MAAKTKFRGSFTALVTPFKNGSVDEAAFRGLVSWQSGAGCNTVSFPGYTGESPTLSHAEHHRVVEMCSMRRMDACCHRRRGLELNARSRRPCCSPEKAVRCRPGGDAVLKQATPEGMVSALKAGMTRSGSRSSLQHPPRSVVDMSVETMTGCRVEATSPASRTPRNLSRVVASARHARVRFIQLSGRT